MKLKRDVTQMADADLIAEVSRLATDERAATVQLLVHLGEMDRRQLHLALGFPSLIAYGIEVLKLSEDASYNRVQAARASRRYPEILPLLETGQLSITTVRMLSKHLTPANASRLIAAAIGKTRAQAEALLASEFPQADARASVRKLPERVVAPLVEAAPEAAVDGTDGRVTPPSCAPLSPLPASPTPPKRLEAIPLSADRYRITFTASSAMREKLRRAQD